MIPKIGIISITTPGDVPNTFADKSNIIGILRLSFHDIRMRDRKGIQMTEEDAEKIAEFVHKCEDKKVDEIWVHCDAGVSRSAGVGAAILKYLTGNDDRIFNSPRYMPNTVCYRLTLNALMKKEQNFMKKKNEAMLPVMYCVYCGRPVNLNDDTNFVYNRELIRNVIRCGNLTKGEMF